MKLVPYFALGQFDATNLTASAVLMPIAPLATLAGAWLVRRMRPEVFYPFTYATVALIAVKLVVRRRRRLHGMMTDGGGACLKCGDRGGAEWPIYEPDSTGSRPTTSR